MPVPKKGTTTYRETARLESSASPPLLPEPQEFHQHPASIPKTWWLSAAEFFIFGVLNVVGAHLTKARISFRSHQ